MNLQKFANLRDITVNYPGRENLNQLQDILATWEPATTKRRLQFNTYWRDVWSNLDVPEGHNDRKVLSKFVGIIERSCDIDGPFLTPLRLYSKFSADRRNLLPSVDAPPLSVEIDIRAIPMHLHKDEQKILTELKALFPKTSQKGKLTIHMRK